MKGISVAIVACLVCACNAKVIKRSVVKHEEYGLAVVDSQDPSSLAHGSYDDDTVQTEGWGKLHIATTKSGSLEAWNAAGYLEGHFTADRIWQHYKSWFDFTFGSKQPSDKVLKFLNDQYDWSALQVKKHPHDPLWVQIGRVNAYFEGLATAQAKFASPNMTLSRQEMLILQAAGDLYDILPALHDEEMVMWEALTSHETLKKRHERISCSALWKMSDDMSDVYVAHATWSSFQNLLRVFKHYDLHGDAHGEGRYKVRFSSKPGLMYSKDDFYTLPLDKQKLVVTETTNGVMNNALYKNVRFDTLLTWQNIMMANALAHGGQEWTILFAKYMSGTYANQYMIGDYKKFTPGSKPKQDFLWIIEVAPGIYYSEDVTGYFNTQGHCWPSYNVPWSFRMYHAAGFQEAFEKHGNEYSYEHCPRGEIFRRDNSTVQSLEGMQRIIRYNNWKVDPLSLGNPGNAIASRYDLEPNPDNVSTFGALDAKVSSSKLMMHSNGAIWAESGPTHDQQPVFSWSNFPTVIHYGQPETFNFTFVLMQESESEILSAMS